MLQTFLPTSHILKICLFGIVAIILLLPLHAFLSTWGGANIGPLLLWKSWKEILLGIIFVLFLAWSFINHSRTRALLYDRLIWVIAAYALVTILDGIWHLSDNGIAATAAGILSNLRFPLIFALTYAIFTITALDGYRWQHYALRFLIIIGSALAAIGIIQVLLLPADFLAQFGYEKNVTIAPFTLIDDNPDALRAFATLRGPNDFGAYLILPLLASLLIGLRHRFVWALSAIILLGIIFSGSRSAWLGTIAGILVLAMMYFGSTLWRSKKLLMSVIVAFVVGVSVVYASLTVPALRLAIFHSSPEDASLTEGSTDAHWQATNDGIQRVITSPLGCGPGCSGPASYYGDDPKISENYFVQIAEETGVVGLGLFLTMLVMIVRRLYQQRTETLSMVLVAGLLGIMIIGLWLHVLSDDPLSLTVFALLGLALGVKARQTQTKKVL